MARVLYGSIITDMMGSIGGLSFQHNRSGKIVRQRAMPTKLPTTSQQSKQSIYVDLIKEWFDIDESDRGLWNAFADSYTRYNKWNEEKTLNGYNWFLAINGMLQIVGDSLRTQPSSWETPLAIPSYQALPQCSIVKIQFDSSFAHTNHYLLIYSSSYLRSESVYDRKQLRLTKVVAKGTDTIIDFTSEWESVHGLSYPPGGSNPMVNILVGVMSVRGTFGYASAFNLERGSYYCP